LALLVAARFNIVVRYFVAQPLRGVRITAGIGACGRGGVASAGICAGVAEPVAGVPRPLMGADLLHPLVAACR